MILETQTDFDLGRAWAPGWALIVYLRGFQISGLPLFWADGARQPWLGPRAALIWLIPGQGVVYRHL